MSTQALSDQQLNDAPAAEINRVETSAPFHWIGAGIGNFLAAPGPSLVYGTLFGVAAGATLWASMASPGFTVAFLTGLLLIGPALAAGLYVAARQQDAGEDTSILSALALLRSRTTNLALFGVFLALVMAAWVRLSALLFAIKFNTVTVTVDGYLGTISGTGDPMALVFFLLVGLALAVIVFVTSAVAVPMIVDRDCGPIPAIQASARAVAGNWPTMIVWAALIVLLTGVGIVTGFVGMLAIFPILGYATWHSYRSLVR
jgi:uncharacterized membrane protein